LGEACKASQNEREDSGGHGIEGSEVAYAALSGDATDAIDDIVRGESGGFVEDEDGVDHSLLSSRKAGWRSTVGWYTGYRNAV
jgi:hypothetical protein